MAHIYIDVPWRSEQLALLHFCLKISGATGREHVVFLSSFTFCTFGTVAFETARTGGNMLVWYGMRDLDMECVVLDVLKNEGCTCSA